jgi:hypothetical protein
MRKKYALHKMRNYFNANNSIIKISPFPAENSVAREYAQDKNHSKRVGRKWESNNDREITRVINKTKKNSIMKS